MSPGERPTPLAIDPRLTGPAYPAWAFCATVMAVLSLIMPGCGNSSGTFNGPVPVGGLLQLLAHYALSGEQWHSGLAAIVFGIMAGALLMVAAPFMATYRLRRPAGRWWYGVDWILFSPWALFFEMGGALLWGYYVFALTFTAQWIVLTLAARAGRRYALSFPPPSPTVAAGEPPP